ncbi:MAG: ABC transporter ATP-binding protein [Flavobacteriaceae bacterium]
MFEISGLSAGYRPRSSVVTAIDIAVDAGQAVGMIGRNGAGKTCLALTMIGKLLPHAGTIKIAGTDITGLGSRERIKRGISLVPEGRMIFGQLTVDENLAVAAYGAGVVPLAADLEHVRDMFPVLRKKARHQAASMSGGEQQMLAIARALLQRPQFMILDEPSLGLAPVAIDGLIEVLASIRTQGVGLVLMEQNKQILRDLCDTVQVLDQGKVSRVLSASDLDDDNAVAEVFLS